LEPPWCSNKIFRGVASKAGTPARVKIDALHFEGPSNRPTFKKGLFPHVWAHERRLELQAGMRSATAGAATVMLLTEAR